MKIGTVIVADIQTDAIGTHGRKWYTNNENNIAFSLAVFPNENIDKFENLTIRVAEMLVEIFKELYKIRLDIKEPNDLVIKNKSAVQKDTQQVQSCVEEKSCYKKVGGILCETKLQGENVKCLVVGIGINTNQKEFVEEIRDIATSIKNAYGIQVDNREVIKRFCDKFERELAKRSVPNRTASHITYL